MAQDRKSAFLQIRVSAGQKAALRRQAKLAGVDLSQYVLTRALPEWERRLQSLLDRLANAPTDAALLAAIGDGLKEISSMQFLATTGALEVRHLSDLDQAMIAAMIEDAAARNGAPAPRWTKQIGPLDEPYFATQLPSVRLHLLTSSPPSYRRRNLFLDASLADRV